MNSLVLDFENKINNKEYTITDLLRHCLIIARKLKQKDFIEWINNELNGYEDKKVPSYREIPLYVKFFNPHYGWCPYVITQKEVCDGLSHMPLRIPISEVEASSNNKDSDVIRYSVPPQIKQLWMESIDFDTDFCYEGNKTSMIRIIDAVKNEMINWVLMLEENGIVDDNFIFDSSQIKKANKITSQVVNNFYGDKSKIELKQIIDK